MTQNLHEVVVTAIIIRDGKYLIIQRSGLKKRFPLKWVVPGGRLESSDYLNLPKDTEYYWYNVLEQTLRREVKEETNLEITDIKYLTSLARVHEDGAPSLVISCTARSSGGEIKLQGAEAEKYDWVTLEEAKEYDLIDGILDELAMAEAAEHGEGGEWQRFLKK